MESCWNESAQIRPTFEDLVNSTKEALDKTDSDEQVHGANTLRNEDYLVPKKSSSRV